MSAKIIPFPNAHERLFQNKKRHMTEKQFNDYLLHEYIYNDIVVDPIDLQPFFMGEDPEE